METTSDHPNVTVEESSAVAAGRRRIAVDFLFLDRETCTRCAGTETALEAAIDRVAPLLDDIGVDVDVRPIHVDSADAARRTELEVSPTIRIDGRDVQPDVMTSACANCGEYCADGAGIDCRLWTYRGETHATPPVELLVEAILEAAVGRPEAAEPDRRTDAFRLSDDLEAVFDRSAGDGERSGCGC